MVLPRETATEVAKNKAGLLNELWAESEDGRRRNKTTLKRSAPLKNFCNAHITHNLRLCLCTPNAATD